MERPPLLTDRPKGSIQGDSATMCEQRFSDVSLWHSRGRLSDVGAIGGDAQHPLEIRRSANVCATGYERDVRISGQSIEYWIRR